MPKIDQLNWNYKLTLLSGCDTLKRTPLIALTETGMCVNLCIQCNREDMLFDYLTIFNNFLISLVKRNGTTYL